MYTIWTWIQQIVICIMESFINVNCGPREKRTANSWSTELHNNILLNFNTIYYNTIVILLNCIFKNTIRRGFGVPTNEQRCRNTKRRKKKIGKRQFLTMRRCTPAETLKIEIGRSTTDGQCRHPLRCDITETNVTNVCFIVRRVRTTNIWIPIYTNNGSWFKTYYNEINFLKNNWKLQ